MNTRIPPSRISFSGDQRNVFPKPVFTPPTPSTIKTDSDTVEIVKGAIEKLEQLQQDGVLAQDQFESLRAALRQSEKTANQYKEDGKILYSKLIDRDDRVAELHEEVYTTQYRLKQQNAFLMRENQNLRRNAPSVSDAPQPSQKASSGNQPLLKQCFSRPKSHLKTSTTVDNTLSEQASGKR